MNVSEWQSRLEKYFTENDFTGGENLKNIIKQESDYGD